MGGWEGTGQRIKTCQSSLIGLKDKKLQGHQDIFISLNQSSVPRKIICGELQRIFTVYVFHYKQTYILSFSHNLSSFCHLCFETMCFPTFLQNPRHQIPNATIPLSCSSLFPLTVNQHQQSRRDAPRSTVQVLPFQM